MRSRIPGPDVVRGMAMLAMTGTHAQRILPPATKPWLGQFLMDWEPVIPTLFALLLGFGIAISLRDGTDMGVWRAKQRQRGLWLAVLSAALFFVHFGPQWPAILTSTGILQCLGIGILVTSICAPSGALALGVGAVLFLGWTGLEATGAQIDGLNRGSFPLFPYLPFVLLAFGTVRIALNRNLLQWALGLGGLVATIWMWHSLGWGHLGQPGSGVVLNHQIFHFTRAHQSDGFTLLTDLLQGVPATASELAFWHTRPALALFLLTSCATAAFLASGLVRLVPWPFALFSLAGRHSLAYYVLHFAGLGAFLLLPTAWRALPWTWAVGALATFLLGAALFACQELFFRKERT